MPDMIPVTPTLYERLRLAPWHRTNHIQPHSYIVEWEAPALYQEMQALITAHGYDVEFRGFTYRYVHLDGFKYWTVPPVLSREPLPVEAMDGQ
jgi:hypothetical protein